MQKNPFIHVVHKNDSWAIEEEGQDTVMSIHDTKEEAVNAARDIARKNKVELIIHNLNGRISRRNSYGHDPRNIPG